MARRFYRWLHDGRHHTPCAGIAPVGTAAHVQETKRVALNGCCQEHFRTAHRSLNENTNYELSSV